MRVAPPPLPAARPIMGGASPIDYHPGKRISRCCAGSGARMVHAFLRTLVKVTVASLIVGTVLAHFGVTAVA
jgi:hypothetical protein